MAQALVSSSKASSPSLVWYYLDYLNPLYLQRILQVVMDKLWKAPPQVDGNALEMEEVGPNGFQPNEERVHLPKEALDLVERAAIAYNVRLSPNLLNNIGKDERLLRILLGNSVDPKTSLAAMQVLCKKDPDFLNSRIYHANRENSLLHDLIHDSYVEGYHEEPLRIYFSPSQIDVEDKDDSLWLNCVYKGTLVTQAKKDLPFEAICSYNLLNPQISSRSLFFRDPERFKS